MSDIRAQSRRDAEFDRLLNDRDDVDYGYTEQAMREAYEMGKRHGREEAKQGDRDMVIRPPELQSELPSGKWWKDI